MGSIAEMHDVHYSYPLPNGGRIDALRGVDLSIEEGEFVALIGANGSGKSTLARLMNGLLLPSRGEVLVGGVPTDRKDRLRDIRSTVSLVFQSPHDQIVGSTVEEDVAFGPENLGLPTDEIGKRVRKSLEQVDMWDLRERPPFQLSAGQAQRVAIAGALAMKPRLLILDEATAMLDPAGRKKVLAILRGLHHRGMSILLITHFMEEAALADRLIVIHRGRIVDDAAPREVFARDDLLSLGLDVPEARKAAESLREVLPDLPTDVLTVEELLSALEERLAGAPSPAPRRRHSAEPYDGNAIIRVEDLWHTYMKGTPLETVALRGVDFSLFGGVSVGLMGGTGSGKSTLLQHLDGLLLPEKGRVTVFGTDILRMKDRLAQLRRSIAMVFQRPEDQVFERFVGDDIAYGLRGLGLSREELRSRVKAAMESVGLDFDLYKDRLTYALSGGERRKVALAGALVLSPKVLLLDEPTSGLDPVSHADLLARFKEWKNSRGVDIVYSSHIMEDIVEMTEEAYVMDGGRVVMHGSVREIFDRPERLESLWLDVPIAPKLAHGLRTSGVQVPHGILTVDELKDAISEMVARR